MPKKLGNTNVYFIEELSKLLGITPTTCRIYFRSGKLKGRILGGRWFITESNLEKFIEGNKEENKKD